MYKMEMDHVWNEWCVRDHQGDIVFRKGFNPLIMDSKEQAHSVCKHWINSAVAQEDRREAVLQMY